MPPPDIKLLIDKTAASAEELGESDKKNDQKYGFLNPWHEYHR